MKKMNLAEGIASWQSPWEMFTHWVLALFVVVLAGRLATGHVGATQPKPAQNYPPEILNWFLCSLGEIVLGRRRPHKQSDEWDHH